MKRISAVLASLLFLSGCGVSAENSESSPYTETAFTTIAEEATATSATTSRAKYTAETTTASALTAVYTAKQPKKAAIQKATAVSAPEPVSTAEAAVTSTAESTRAPRTTATETTVTSTAAVVTTTAVPRTEPAVTTSIVTEPVTEAAAEPKTILPNDGSDYGKASAIYEYMLRNGSGTCVNRACQTYELCVDNGLDCCIVWTRAELYGHVANIVRVEGIWYVLDTDGEFFLTYNNGFTEAVDIDGNHIAESDIQIEYYTNYINSNPEWTLAGIFADEGISGTQTKNRTEFNRMIRMCKKKKIDLVLCKSTSRFARNTVDCLDHIRLLKSLGIGVIFEKENINTLTAQSEFILSLYSSFAQAESESISKNITLGNQMAFKEGKVRYNYKYLLGYKKGDDGKPVIIPEEAEVIQLIFKLYIDGGSTHTIAQELNNKKYPTRSKSGKWSAMLIKRILQNEKYIGDCLLQKTYTIDCISHKAVKNNGERPMYYVSDCHPAIIDKSTFNIVQQEIARRNAKRSVCTNTITEQGRYNSKYALTELLICGECGTAYRRCRWTSHNRNRTVWRCINRLEHGPKYCKSPTIDEEPLHNAIVRAINEFYNCSDDVAKVLKSATDTVLSGSNDDEIRQIEQRLKDIDQARNGFVNLITTGACAPDSLDDEFARLYSEEERLSQKLLSLKSQGETKQNELVDDIKADIDNSSFELHQYDDVLVRKVVECVKILSKEEITVTFKGGYEVKSELLT